MRSYYIIIVFAAALAVISCGCSMKESHYGKFTEEEVSKMAYAKVEGLPEPSGGVTISVMSETVSADEVVNNEPVLATLARILSISEFYEVFAVKARPLIVEEIKNIVSKKYIYYTAKKNAPSSIDEMLEKIVKKEVDRHLANYDNNGALALSAFKTEKEFIGMGVTDWKSFREYKKMMFMVRMYLSKKIKKDKPIMLDDMKARYNAYITKEIVNENKPPIIWDYKLKMRVIDIHPDKLAPNEIDSANEETRQQAALRKGKELLNLINEKGEDFGKLAEAHSHGVGNDTSGLWAERIFGSLAEPYDTLEKAADKMNISDVSNVIEVKGHVFIMKLEDKREGGTVPFADVQGRMESEIRDLQQQIEYEKVLSEIVDQIDVRDLDIFTDYCLKRAFELITN